MSNINRLVLEATNKVKDFKKIHGHSKINFDSPEAYFHNFATHEVEGSPLQTPGYQHCTGPTSNFYIIDHIGRKHGINKEYSKGHGPEDAQWFKFTKKINKDWWDLSSGIKVDLKNVPKSFLP